jgi:hypothetical protein
VLRIVSRWPRRQAANAREACDPQLCAPSHSGYDVARIQAIFHAFSRSHRYCAHTTAIERPEDCADAIRQRAGGAGGIGCSMAINLHRMLALALLCVGLFVATGPAFACCAQGSPTQDCCPTRSHEAGTQYEQTGSPSASQNCCVVGAQTSLGTAFDVTQSTPEHQADAPFSLVYLATLSTTDSTVWVGGSATTPAFPALSPVYLRTGRLRL